MPFLKNLDNHRGATPLFLLVALIGLLFFFILTNTVSFKNDLFSSLYPKKQSLAASEPLGIQPGQPIDDSGNILIPEAVADRLKSTGAGWVRINFRLGPYSSDTSEFYSKYDTIIDHLKARGLQVVGLMSNESWPGSQSQWTENNFEHTGRDGHNSYIDQFGYAFGRLAKHYEGKIKYWEIWNEPNCYSESPSPGVYTGCSFIYPSNFAAMLAHVHTQAHYYNNIDVQIIAGAVFGHDISGFGTGPAGADYLDETFNTGINKTGKFAWTKATYGSYPLDGVGQHIYITGNRAVDEVAFSNYLDYIHNVLVKYEGPSSTKQTWVTEYGWATNQTDEVTQANNLSKVVPIMRGKSYVANSFWFQLDESPGADLFYGLYRTDFSTKPAYSVFKSLNPTASPTPGPVQAGQKTDGTIVTAIANYYNTHGGASNWGTPFDNGSGVYAHMWDFGFVQDFNGGTTGKGTIFDSGHGLSRGFWNKYMQVDNHLKLKFPTSEEYPYQEGTRQDFQGGYMTWDPINKVRVFIGPQSTPTPTPSPTPSPTPTPNPAISAGQKADGTIVTAIKNYYDSHGGKTNLGLPFDNGGGPYAHYWDFGYVQDFNGGTTGKGAIFDTGHGVAHDFWKTYLTGNNHTILKFPTTEEYPFRGGTRQDFQGGSMFWDSVNQVRVFPK